MTNTLATRALTIDILDMMASGAISHRDLITFALHLGQDPLMYGAGGDHDSQKLAEAATDLAEKIKAPQATLSYWECEALLYILQMAGHYAHMCDYAEDGDEQEALFAQHWNSPYDIIKAALQLGVGRTFEVFGR